MTTISAMQYMCSVLHNEDTVLDSEDIERLVDKSVELSGISKENVLKFIQMFADLYRKEELLLAVGTYLVALLDGKYCYQLIYDSDKLLSKIEHLQKSFIYKSYHNGRHYTLENIEILETNIANLPKDAQNAEYLNEIVMNIQINIGNFISSDKTTERTVPMSEYRIGRLDIAKEKIAAILVECPSITEEDVKGVNKRLIYNNKYPFKLIHKIANVWELHAENKNIIPIIEEWLEISIRG